MSIFLGLDSSTQSLTATAIEVDGASRQILFTQSFRFDEILPAYGTRYGVLPSSDPAMALAPPLMWAEALEVMFEALTTTQKIDWTRLRAISGSGQQHGSVYLNARASERLSALDPRQPLAQQLQDVFARDVSPIWMDSSTSAQCAEIEGALGGARAVARLTGSRAFERFTGPQIRKFAQQNPEAYAQTTCIQLVSSWLASVLAGTLAPIDHGDGSGMNLMDLGSRHWSPEALAATAHDLSGKLPRLAESWSIAGTLAPFWIARFGLPRTTRVVVWSGDNPCSLVGTGLVREGRVAVSLGTSDTIFGLMAQPRVSDDGTGHVFASPTGDYMGMTVFRNGSLARERMRDAYGLDWKGFSDAIRSVAPGCGGATLLPWFEPEITPLVLQPGVRRYGLDAADASANVRALVEGQLMAMARHSRWMGVHIDVIHATGGAAENPAILDVMADVFNAEVLQVRGGNSAALGAALRAFHADRKADGLDVPWDEVVAGFADPISESRRVPDPARAAVYQGLIKIYASREAEALGGKKAPARRWETPPANMP